MKVNVAMFTDCCCCHQRRQAASLFSSKQFQGAWHLERGHKGLPLWQLHELDLEEVPEGQQAHAISTQQHCCLSPCQPVQNTARNSPQAAVTALAMRADTASENAEKQAWGITKNAEFWKMSEKEKVRIEGSRGGIGRIRQPGIWLFKNNH